MAKIDLDAIIKDKVGMLPFDAHDGIILSDIREVAKEAIHQALILASEKATAKERHGLAGIWLEVDKQSILDVEKLIV